MRSIAALVKRARIRCLLTLWLIAGSFLIFQAAANSQLRVGQPSLVLTILHTNDLHAHDEPFDERGHNVGGVARIAHLIRAIRTSTPNVLVIDGGDIFQGTSFFKYYHGETEVALLNQAGYDIYTIGNHEFDEGADNLARQLKNAKFAIISANLDAAAVPELNALVKPSVIKVIGGQKVGFVGGVTPDLVAMSLKARGLRIKGVEPGNDTEWMTPIKAEVERLDSQGIDKIILVTHIGVERDRQLAEEIPQVDAIVGGHSHTRLGKPIIVTRADGSQAIIVQAGCYGRALGKLRLEFDNKGRLIFPGTRSYLISIDSRTPEAPEIKAYLAEKGKPIASLRNQVAGVALADFDNRFASYPWDSPIGDLICDALAEAGTTYGATISFHNRGGVRARIDKGLITMEKVEEVLPFENHLIFATVKGATILKALEYSLSGMLGARFLDVHGLKVAYDHSRPRGSRLVFVLTNDGKGSFAPINPNADYKIALNDFTFNGGEGYDFSGATNVKATTDRLSKVLAAYLIKHKKVGPSPPSRIVPVAGGLLSVVDADAQQQLAMSCPEPRAQMTLVVGDGRGVETLSGAIPVPLCHPKVIQTAVRPKVESGPRARPMQMAEYFWRLPLKLGPAQPATWTSRERWAAVLIHPPRPRSAAKTVICEPVRLPDH